MGCDVNGCNRSIVIGYVAKTLGSAILFVLSQKALVIC
jgi:hypothetical protein